MVLIIKETGIEDYLDAGTANIKALIMGAPGAGKTRSSSYWPKPILADCEKGRMAVADRKMPYAEILSIADMDALLKMLDLECRKPVDQRQFQTLIIDTLDSYQRIMIKERLDAEHKEALSGWQDWGYLDGKMTQFVAKLHALPMNIVINMHIKESMVAVGGSTDTDDDDTAKIQVSKPKLKGDYKDQIAAEFDLVGHMGTYWEAQNGERVMLRGIQWWPDPNHPILKDRSGQLPRWTPVTFTEEDHANLFGHLVSHLDSLGSGDELMSLQTDAAITTDPVAPQAGGPVAAPMVPPTSTKAKAAPKVTEPAVAPATEVVQSVGGPVVAGPPPAAPVTPTPVVTEAPESVPASSPTEPESAGATPTPVATETEASTQASEVAPEPSVAHDEAVSAVTESLGGAVISDPAPTEAASTTPVVEQGQAGEADGATGALLCGTGTDALLPGEDPAPGCGKVIEIDGPNAESNPMLVEIAGLKYRTHMCNACFTAHRATN